MTQILSTNLVITQRAVDDWVFMCFFVGNDFLPHLPSLEIREGGIDRLVTLYKSNVYRTGGFLTDSGLVNPERVQLIMQELGTMEDSIFKDRQRRELDFRASDKAKKRRNAQQTAHLHRGPSFQPGGQFAPQALGGGRGGGNALTNVRQEAANMRMQGANGEQKGQKRGIDEVEEDEDANDEVRLWEDGFKARYYQGCSSWKWYFPYHYAPFASDFVNTG